MAILVLGSMIFLDDLPGMIWTTAPEGNSLLQVMYRLVPALVQQMGQAFPELGRAQALIEETLKLEETRFKQMLDRGLGLLDDALQVLPDGVALPGAVTLT